jgi:hypothetical protein
VPVLLATAAAAAAIVLPSPAHAAAPGPVEIRNSASGLRADVMWASTASLTGVFLWPDNASLSQEFNLLHTGNGHFRIQARHSGQCLILDWRGGSYVNGTRIVQHSSCTPGYAPGEWRTETRPAPACTTWCFGDNKVVLVNRATGRCLDAANSAGGAPRSKAVLQQWDCIASRSQWNSGNQLWELVIPTSAPPVVIR